MPTFLGQIERMLERAFELPAQRFFRTRLQPVELARALERTMAAEGQIGPTGLSVPNRYVVDLHPEELARFASSRDSLQRDLATYVLHQVQRRGWACLGWPEVELHQADNVPRGRVRITATTVDREPDRARPSPSAESAEQTRVLPPRPQHPAEPGPRNGRAWLELEDGRRIDLAGLCLRVGRSRDNDVVLDHESVSRHHAEIRREPDGLLIRDLGSTNGTRVDGQSIQELALSPGATIHIGAVPMRLRIGG